MMVYREKGNGNISWKHTFLLLEAPYQMHFFARTSITLQAQITQSHSVPQRND